MVKDCIGLSEELFLMCTTVFNLYIIKCTTVEDTNTTKLKGVMKKHDLKGSFFQNLDNFYISVFRKPHNCPVCSFC